MKLIILLIDLEKMSFLLTVNKEGRPKMKIIFESTKLLIISLAVIYSYLYTPISHADVYYTSNELFNIPWSSGIWSGPNGEVSTVWNLQDPPVEYSGYIDPPGPWATNENNFILVDFIESGGILHKYDMQGTWLNSLILDSLDASYPDQIEISNNGYILLNKRVYSGLVYTQNLILLDPELNLVKDIQTGMDYMHILSITRSIHNSFYVEFVVSPPNLVIGDTYNDTYLIEVTTDGNISSPELLGSMNRNSGIVFYYITSNREFKDRLEDLHGNYYQIEKFSGSNVVEVYSPSDELLHAVYVQSGSGYGRFQSALNRNIIVSTNGDIFTLHADSQGVFLSKHTQQFNNPPICVVNTVTPMPYIGPLPASIEFDATGCSDPDPGDSITYEWDFDGDGNFSEPIDDA
ncbi:MAG TPA: hypothetical protein VGB30_01765, partial [bacterium]